MGNTQKKTINSIISYDRDYIKNKLSEQSKKPPQATKVSEYLNSMRKYEQLLWSNILPLTHEARDHFYALAEFDYEINAKAVANNQKKQLKKIENMSVAIENLEAELAKLKEPTILFAEKYSTQKFIDKEELIETNAANINHQKEQLKKELKKLSPKLRNLYKERERIKHLPVGLALNINIKF